MQCRKRDDLQKGHPAKAATILVNQVLQESQAEAVSLDSKKRTMEEKAKFSKLLAEGSFLIKRQIAKNETERLKVQELVAKAKARAKVFEEFEFRDG